MSNQCTAWIDYHEAYCKQQAIGDTEVKLEYGETLYQSPEVPVGDSNNRRHIRWFVTKFKDQYHVFCETLKRNGKTEKQHAASFSWKEAAMKFALEMLLICTRRLTRKGITLHKTTP